MEVSYNEDNGATPIVGWFMSVYFMESPKIKSMRTGYPPFDDNFNVKYVK